MSEIKVEDPGVVPIDAKTEFEISLSTRQLWDAALMYMEKHQLAPEGTYAFVLTWSLDASGCRLTAKMRKHQ